MNPPQPTKTLKVDHLPIKIYKDADSLGKAAALEARRIIQEAIDERKKANIILATGNSQLNFLESLNQAALAFILFSFLKDITAPEQVYLSSAIDFSSVGKPAAEPETQT